MMSLGYGVLIRVLEGGWMREGVREVGFAGVDVAEEGEPL